MPIASAVLSLDDAVKVASGALKAGRDNRLNPLTVVVLDSGGKLKFFAKEDGSSLLRREIATGKAYGALGLHMDSADVNKIADARPLFATSLFSIAEGGVVPVPGGVIIHSSDGKTVLGAVGISGDLSVKDEACAVAGIVSAGLQCKHSLEGSKSVLTAHDQRAVNAAARNAASAWRFSPSKL